MGSDHFPIFICLQLAERKREENKKEILKADAGEERIAEQKIRKAV
jgi:hypothetical protein